MIVSFDTEHFNSENFHNALDILDRMSDNELETLETLCNIVLTERRVFGQQRIVNKQVESFLEVK